MGYFIIQRSDVSGRVRYKTALGYWVEDREYEGVRRYRYSDAADRELARINSRYDSLTHLAAKTVFVPEMLPRRFGGES